MILANADDSGQHCKGNVEMISNFFLITPVHRNIAANLEFGDTLKRSGRTIGAGAGTGEDWARVSRGLKLSFGVERLLYGSSGDRFSFDRIKDGGGVSLVGLETIEPYPSQRRDLPGKFNRCLPRSNATPPHADIDLDQYSDFNTSAARRLSDRLGIF